MTKLGQELDNKG